ncbi:hypothetical protein SELMODRAFT_450679 [Selaginella moellendorffii]|uniref:Uncharacterized protein CHR8-1 n=1 Tax=Selaginella moellendorffii TaxID=88036 RepID=D8T0J0_SELML|nr:hypothetical protein SELMODRAFT_450679 [Selaginella moellendorffii]
MEEDEELLQRLGVTAARAEDVERHVIAAQHHQVDGGGGGEHPEAIAKQLTVLQKEIDAVENGLERYEEDGGELHTTLAHDRLHSLNSKKKKLRARLKSLDGASPSTQEQRSCLLEDNDLDAALDAASGLVETERDRLIRTGALTPFDRIKGFERRVQTLSDRQSLERDRLAETSLSNAVASLAAISRSRATTKLLDPAQLPTLEAPTREFRRPPKSLDVGRRKKRKRPLPESKWRRKKPHKLPELAADDNDGMPSFSCHLILLTHGDDNDVNDEECDDDVILEGGLRIPLDIYDRLFDYQKTGVKWLWELHSLKTGGIIGDEMGLGKTVQVIAFLAALHHSRMYSPSIVVCPVTLTFQWKREVEKWYPKFDVQVVHESAAPKGKKKEAEDSDASGDDSGDAKRDARLARWDGVVEKTVRSPSGLIVTTYEQLRLLKDTLLDIDWGYAVLDEGHRIRNPDAETTLICKQLQTVHRIIMTGAPIQNKLTELWSLFDFVFPGKLGVLPVFQAQFALPISIGGYANATSLQVSTAYKCAVTLRDLIMPYILRRMKSDVEAKLTKKTEHVLFCSLTETQRACYRAFLASSDVERIFEGSKNALYGIDILRKICNHPDLLEREASEKHADYGLPDRSGKLMVVSQVLNSWKDQGHRVLVFCQTQQMLDIVEIFVESQGYTYRRMDGSTSVKQRPALIDEFNESSHVFVFLLTTKVGGLGTNLTGANRVIIFDPDWNPSTDMQARERAWRIGQTKDVIVYRLITRGTIEEKVYHRQIYKQFLTNKILRDPQQRRVFKSKDMRDLFVLHEDAEGDKTETSNLFPELKLPAAAESDGKEAAHGGEEGDQITRDEQDGADESRLLQSLMQANGIHSAMDHDAILAVNDPERVKVDFEASRVAERAAEALQQSRLIRMRDDVAVPTWTGNSGAAGAPGGGRRRFGAAVNSRLMSPAPPPGTPGASSSRALSSVELLAQMRQRQAGAVESKREALRSELERFLRSHGGSALSTTVVQHFKLKLSQAELPLFRQLLNEIATLNKDGGESRWILKHD